MVLGWMLALLLWDGPVTLQTKVQLESPGDDSEYFFDTPLAFDAGDKGFYLVDGGAKVLFHWSPEGAFLGTIGKPGSGPGEFVFSSRGRPSGHVVLHNDKVIVHDGGQRKILVFNQDGEFEKTVNMGVARSRITEFAVTESGDYLIQRSRFNEDSRTNEIVVLDGDGQVKTTVTEQPLTGFSMRGSGRNRQFTIRAFNPGLVSHYNVLTGEIIYGQSDENNIKVQTLDGRPKVIKLGLPKLEVTQADREEFDLTISDRARGRVNYEFPDHKPFYDQILPVGSRGFLVFSASPHYRDIHGIFINRDGKVEGRYQFRCGESGGLIGARGRILKVSLDEYDEFQIAEITL